MAEAAPGGGRTGVQNGNSRTCVSADRSTRTLCLAVAPLSAQSFVRNGQPDHRGTRWGWPVRTIDAASCLARDLDVSCVESTYPAWKITYPAWSTGTNFCDVVGVCGMPTYQYHCPSNGETVEVQHGMLEELTTWGDVCRRAGIGLGSTPAEAPVERLISGGLLGTVVGGTPSSASPSLLPMAGCCGNPAGCRRHG
jgi:hypothetical protein